MYHIWVIGLLLIFLACTAGAQTKIDKDPEQLLLAARKSPPDTNRIALFLKIGEFYISKRGYGKYQIGQALHFSDQAIELSDSLHNVGFKNKGLLLKGECLLDWNEIEKGRPYFVQVIEYYQRHNNNAKAAETWAKFEDYVHRIDELSCNIQADCYMHALIIYEKANNRSMAAMMLEHVADDHLNTNKLDKAETELLRATQKRNIQLLKEQAQLQETQARQATLIRNLIIISSGILLALLGVMYGRYRAKKRVNLQLENKRIEISGKNAQLEKLLKDNEWLLREVHHRVKNNLQMITALLRSQSVFLKDQTALNAIAESRNRVQAMALIHQKLYKSTNFSTIYMPEYMQDLVGCLKDSFETKNAIYFAIEIQPVFLDIAYAVPVGLIVNEIVTNAIKYAFPFTDEDQINIKLFESENTVHLEISDNGRGLPPDFDKFQDSFGMLLMTGLTEEIGGSFKITGDNGTTVVVTFQNNNLVYPNSRN